MIRTHTDIHRIAKLIQEELAQSGLKDKLDLETIEKVLMYQFNYAKDIMEQGELKDVILPGLGKIKVKKWRKHFMDKKGSQPVRKDTLTD